MPTELKDTLTILDPLIVAKNAEIALLDTAIATDQSVISGKQDSRKTKLKELYQLQKRALAIIGINNTGIKYDVKDQSIKNDQT